MDNSEVNKIFEIVKSEIKEAEKLGKKYDISLDEALSIVTKETTLEDVLDIKYKQTRFKYDLGIIGGMGSEATVEIYNRIISSTFHTCDQDHMRICILNNSIIPDRTNYILNNGSNPLPFLNESIKDLENLNVHYFIIPCNTAHYFADKLEYSKIKFINMVEETLKSIDIYSYNMKFCVLSTTGTIKTKIYHNHPFAEKYNFVYPLDEEQDAIMKIINDTKKGVNRNTLKKKLKSIVSNIIERTDGEVLFILACTELSLYYEDVKKLATTVDAMNELVESVIKKCGYRFK